MDLLNKVAIVTGASRGIGKATIELLLKKGVCVAGWGLNEPGYESENFRFFQTDVRKLESVEAAYNNTIKHFGDKIAILVNNAGLGYFGNFDEMAPERFYELYEVNVFGIYHTCRFIIPAMKKNATGHIINISSIAGLEGMPQVAAYCGAKHAVKGITDSLFRELRDSGIKVTGIYPGSVQTDFFRHSEGIQAHHKMLQPEEIGKEIIRVLETNDNFVINELVIRPLKVK